MIPIERGIGFALGVALSTNSYADAAFVKANMPLGLPGTMSDQQAWDVALCMNSHDRPQDPRYTGSVQGTQHDFHATKHSMQGREVAGKVLGASGAPKPFKPLKGI